MELHGYEALSLRGLARTLGVTAPALYDHVESKRALLRAVAELGYEDLGAAFETTAGARALDRCRARARAYVTFAQEHPELFRLMFLYRPAAVIAAVDNELPAATKAFEAGAADMARAVEEGDIVERDVLRLNLTVWAAVHGVASVALLSPELADQLVDDVIDVVFEGLAG